MGDSKKDSSHGILQFHGKNFENWSFRVQLHLDALDLLDVIKDAPPAEQNLAEQFGKKDKKAKSVLVSLIADEYLEYVREKETSKEMWAALECTFAKKSVSSQTLVRKQLANLKMKKNDDLRKHFLLFDELVRKLKSSGATVTENDVVAQLFATLPEYFDPVVTALENMSEADLTVDLVKQRLLAEEAKRIDREDGQSDGDKVAAFSGEHKKFTGVCHRCKKRGHMKKDCRVKLSQNKANVASSLKSVCFMTSLLSTSEQESSSNIVVFKIDSGATDHMCNSKWCFSTWEDLQNPVVISVAKENACIQANSVGCINGWSNGVFVKIKKVLFVPNLRDNLLSVPKLTSIGVTIVFSGEVAYFQKGGVTIMKAYKHGNLYEMQLDCKRTSH